VVINQGKVQHLRDILTWAVDGDNRINVCGSEVRLLGEQHNRLIGANNRLKHTLQVQLQILPYPRSFTSYSRTAFMDYCSDRFF